MVEAQLSLLLNVGLLTRHTASRERYLFAMPNAGPLVRAIIAGRKVIVLPRTLDAPMMPAAGLLTLPFAEDTPPFTITCNGPFDCASCIEVADSLHAAVMCSSSVSASSHVDICVESLKARQRP